MSTTVAIVEDDATVRLLLERWVRDSGAFSCVGTLGSAEEALVVLPRLQPGIVLMDINLPGKSGIECVREAKSLLPTSQFLMLTVYTDADHIFDALAAGAVGYLLKRSTREKLIDAMREIESGGSPMSSDIARKVVQSFQQPAPAVSGPEEDLSARETEVLRMLAEGYLYKEIADALAISMPTVKTYVRRIYGKLQVHSRSQAVALLSRSNRR
jgi:DNA-binding NarL/FixJ family response regulator